MRRPVFASLALIAVLATSFLALTSRAQEATPPAEGIELPPGAAVAILGQLTPFVAPAEASGLFVVRLTLEPGAAIPTHPHPHPEIGVVEAGSLIFHSFEGEPVQVVLASTTDGQTLEAAVGEEVTANAGDVVHVPAGNVSDTRAGDQGASVLIFEFAPAAADATPAA